MFTSTDRFPVRSVTKRPKIRLAFVNYEIPTGNSAPDDTEPSLGYEG